MFSHKFVMIFPKCYKFTYLSSSFTFKDIFYQKGFVDSDSSAIATIDVSASDYNELFKLNVPLWDPSSAIIDTEQVRYFTNASGWTDVSFSHAIVDTSAIFTSHSDQSVKRDFLRSMLKDITGTTRFISACMLIGSLPGRDDSPPISIILAPLSKSLEAFS